MNLKERQSGFKNMNFVLRVEQKELPCKSFHNFEQEIEYEAITEGGNNTYVHLRPKPVAKPFLFQVERYVTEGYEDPLSVGTTKEMLLLLVSDSPGKFQNAQAVFTFRGCLVTGKAYSGMDSEKSGLIVETTTVAYEQLEVSWDKGGGA